MNKVFYIAILLGLILYNFPAKAQSYYSAWEKRYTSQQGSSITNEPRAVVLDLYGNVIIACEIKENGNEHKFLTIKYDAAGNQLWAVKSASTIGNKALRYLKTDASANIYVAGDYYNGSDQNNNCIVIKYNSAGVQQWASVYDGTSGIDTTTDKTFCIDIDINENVYLGGSSIVNGVTNFLTVKINSAGIFEWKALIPTPPGENDFSAVSILSDNLLKRVYVAGWKNVVCYDTHGTELWRVICGDWAKLMLNQGSLYVGFTLNHGPNVLKLNPITGNTIWSTYYYSEAGVGKYTCDKEGNLFACTWTSIDSVTSKWIILKYNSSGVLQWQRDFSSNTYLCEVKGVETDDSLNVYIAGMTSINPSPFSLKRITTLVYDRNGNSLQNNFYSPQDNNGYLGFTSILPLAVNRNGLNYYIAGKERFFPPALNFITINYRSTTLLSAPTSLTAEAVSSRRINLIWEYNSQSPSWFGIERSFVDCSDYFKIDSVPGNITSYIDTVVGPGISYCYRVYAYTDSTRSAYSNSAIDTTLKPVGITGSSNIIPMEYKLYQNYPNPFNPVTNINFDLPKAGLVTLKVYDILGKQVTELVNEFNQAGSYKVKWNASDVPSGIYFYKIETENFIQVRRMILMK